MTENTETTAPAQNNEQTKITEKTSFALLEILVYGLEEDKAEIKKMMENIQAQMAKTKRGKYARILWYIDKGEKTVDEKKSWLIENANAKYYVFTPESNTVKPDFVKNILANIKKFEDSVKAMNGSNIRLAKKKVEQKTEEKTDLKVVK